MKVLNVKTTKLKIKKYSNDWVLLIDGDMIIYRAAWATNKTSIVQAKMSLMFTMYRLMDSYDTDKYIFFLTTNGNHRKSVWPLYKASRTGKDKPVHLEELYKFSREVFNYHEEFGFEADDLIAQNHSEDNTVIISNDKDFDQLVGFHGSIHERCGLRWVNQDEADLFSATQLLTGDRIDDIPGLSEKAPKRGIGAKRASSLLTPWTGRENAMKVILEAYRAKYGDCAEYMVLFNTYLLKLGMDGDEIDSFRRLLDEKEQCSTED